MLYLKIRTEPALPASWWQGLLLRVLPVPRANPDFDDPIPLVCEWLLAFEAADQNTRVQQSHFP